MQIQGIKQENLHKFTVSFATDILTSLIIVKEPEAVAQICFVKSFSYKFLKIHRRTPVPEPMKKETLTQVFSCKF